MLNSLQSFQLNLGRFKLPILGCLFWACFILPRVWSFGFYEGDWWDIAIERDLAHFWEPFSSRPLMVVFYFVLNNGIGFRPWLWQLLLASIVLFSAIVLYVFLRALSQFAQGNKTFSKKGYSFIADLAVVSWLSFPWTLGWSAWPTLIMGLVSLLFILLFSIEFIEVVIQGKNPMLAYGYFFLSIFSYETFYLFFIFLTFIFYFQTIFPIASKRKFFEFIGVLLLIQAVAIGFNRLISLTVPYSSKPANLSAFIDLPNSLLSLFGNLSSAFPQYPIYFIWFAKAFIIILVMLLAILLYQKKSRITTSFLALIFLASTAGIAFSILVYGLGFYGLTGAGTMSRTTLGVSLWFAILIFVAIQVAFIAGVMIYRVAIIALVCSVLFLFTPALKYQNKVWSQAWLEYSSILKNAPALDIESIPPNAVVIYIGPTRVESINFAGTLQLSGAIAQLYPDTRLREDEIFYKRYGTSRLIVAKSTDNTLSWTGQELILSLPGHWVEKIPATEVYEWNAVNNSFRKMLPNQPFG